MHFFDECNSYADVENARNAIALAGTVKKLPKKPESASIPSLSDDEDLSEDENENGDPWEDDICQDGTAIQSPTSDNVLQPIETTLLLKKLASKHCEFYPKELSAEPVSQLTSVPYFFVPNLSRTGVCIVLVRVYSTALSTHINPFTGAGFA